MGNRPGISCFATAGSGKTRWLTERAGDLVGKGEPFAAFTFTRTATAVLKERVSPPEGCWIGTIHSFCAEVLTQSFGEQIPKKLGKSYYDDADFRAMVERPVQLLKEEPAALRSLVLAYPNLLLDEAQDLDQTQFDLVHLLCSAGCTLFQVGDPNQSIYGFAGASPTHMYDLAEEFTPGREELNVNYRCSNQIVEFSNSILGLEKSKGTFEGIPVIWRLITTPEELPGSVDRTILLSKKFLFSSLFHESWVDWSKVNKWRTVHKAKGAEWDKVTVVVASRSFKASDSRLLYVGCTRAIKELEVLYVGV